MGDAAQVVFGNAALVSALLAPLDGEDLARAARVSRVFAAAGRQRELWVAALLRRFPSAAHDAANAVDAAALMRVYRRRLRAVTRGASAVQVAHHHARQPLESGFRWSLEVALHGVPVLGATFHAGHRIGNQAIPCVQSTRATTRLALHNVGLDDALLSRLAAADADVGLTATLTVDRHSRAWAAPVTLEAALVVAGAPIDVVQGADHTVLGVLAGVHDDGWMSNVDASGFSLLIRNAAFSFLQQDDDEDQHLSCCPALFIVLPRENSPANARVIAPEIWLTFLVEEGESTDDASDGHMLELLERLRWAA